MKTNQPQNTIDPKNRSSKVLLPGVIVGIAASGIGPVLSQVIVHGIYQSSNMETESLASSIGIILGCFPFAALGIIPTCIIGAIVGQAIGRRFQKDDMGQSPWAWVGAGLGGIFGMAFVVSMTVLSSII